MAMALPVLAVQPVFVGKATIAVKIAVNSHQAIIFPKQNPSFREFYRYNFGSLDWNRTNNLLLRTEPLFQLSYQATTHIIPRLLQSFHPTKTVRRISAAIIVRQTRKTRIGCDGPAATEEP